MLAMGDAVAVCLLKLRNFSAQNFAEFHPGGSLGKQLYLKVSDIFAGNDLPLVKPNASVKDVIIEISSKRLGAAAVIDDEHRLLGIITDGDLRRMLERESSFSHLSAANIMTASPKTIQSDDFATKALQMMQEKNITQLVVMNGERVVGFVHLHDLLKEGIV
jgi:arabinose-5-phosphate isomerase